MLESRLWSQHGIQIHVKINIYKTCVLSTLLYASETRILYKYQLRKLEQFHQRCLRHILHINWRQCIPDTEVLESACILSIEALICKWSGHLVRMNDSRIPKQLFYGELTTGKRKAGKPILRYKDNMKSYMTKCNIPPDEWESLATDRPKWRKYVFESVQKFEEQRIQKASYKRAVRKKHMVTSPQGVTDTVKCELCGRICQKKSRLRGHPR